MSLLTPTKNLEGSEMRPQGAMGESASLADLFAERSLWKIYLKSGSVYQNRFNCITLIVVSVALTAFSIFDLAHEPSSDRIDLRAIFSTWANVGLSYAATILGFLVAGFSVVVAALNTETAVLLRRIHRPGQDLDELRLMFVNFVSIFAPYTAFIFWCVLYLVGGSPNGPMEFAWRMMHGVREWLPFAVSHALFVVWGVWFLVLVLKMKSFIYNLYQTLLLGLADSMEP